jgi:hypothetical protein
MRDDPPEVSLEKLEALLALAAPPVEDVALLADLLSLAVSDHHPLPSLSPQKKKERTLALAFWAGYRVPRVKQPWVPIRLSR